MYSRQETYDRYKRAEQYAKDYLRRAQRLKRDHPEQRENITRLIAETFRHGHTAERLRTDIMRFYTNPDPGHDAAVQWINDNIMQPAHDVINRLGIPYNGQWIYGCMPSDPSTSAVVANAPGHHHTELLLLSGQVTDKPFLDCCCPIRRAAFLDPNDKQQAFFFVDTASLLAKFKSGDTEDRLLEDPPPTVIDRFPPLLDAGLFRVDAALPNPQNQGEMYFFSGIHYVLMHIDDKTIVNGPKTITAEWPSLNEASFQIVDAALSHPNSANNAYIFSGDKYVEVSIEPGTNNDSLVRPPKTITTEWPSLRQAGFETVDAVFPHPDDRQKAYFFSGSQYAMIEIAPGTNSDSLLAGPAPIQDGWKSLHVGLFD